MHYLIALGHVDRKKLPVLVYIMAWFAKVRHDCVVVIAGLANHGDSVFV